MQPSKATAKNLLELGYVHDIFIKQYIITVVMNYSCELLLVNWINKHYVTFYFHKGEYKPITFKAKIYIFLTFTFINFLIRMIQCTETLK